MIRHRSLQPAGIEVPCNPGRRQDAGRGGEAPAEPSNTARGRVVAQLELRPPGTPPCQKTQVIVPQPRRAAEVLLRTGYTLIELLIAAVLTATLMTVIWGLLSMYNGWLTAGRVQSEERQLRRSLRAQLQDDLEAVAVMDAARDVRFLESAAEATLTEQDAINPDSAEDPLVTAMQPGLEAEDLPTWLQSLQLPRQPQGVPSVSMIGTSTMLRLVVPARMSTDATLPAALTATPISEATAPESALPAETGPAADISAAEDGAAGALPATEPRPSPVRIIIWQFRPWGGVAVAGAGAADTEFSDAPSQPSALAPDPGLTRQEWDGATLLQLAREQSLTPGDAPLDTESGAAPAATLLEPAAPLDEERIPETLAVQFEYFDGQAWQSSWNSTAQAGLPVALRLRMWMVSASAAERFMNQAESTVLTATLPDNSNAAAAGASDETSLAAPVPLQLVETLLVLQPISGAMPGLTDPDAGTGVLGGGL